MKKRVAKVLIFVLSVNMLCIRDINSNISKVKATNEEKTYVALTKNKNLEKEISKIDDEYVVDVKGKQRIYQFVANEDEAESIDHKKNTYVSENIEVLACENGEKNKTKNVNEENSINKEWDMELINNTEDYSNKDSEVIDIAILDSGIDFSSDINVVDVIDLVDENNEFNIFSDMTGHGTSIAGIIASSGETEAIKGINSNVNIYSARILDENNSAPISRVVEGIYWAIEKNVKIINISFGTLEDNEVLKKAISDAVSKGILVIAAAGNTGDEVIYPAVYEGVLSVGSVDSKGEISDFSADDDKIDVMAPGEDVKSVGAFNGSIIVSGTSISTPHVVGMASLLWAKDKSVSADFIKDLIVESSNETNLRKSKKGIIDIDYAFEIYDEFKKKYDLNENNKDFIDLEYDNENILNENVNNYVTGVWNFEGHKEAAAYAGKSYKYTSDQIKILKKGVIYPDQEFGGMGTEEPFENPQWHTAYCEKYYNYISNYICAGMIARKIKKGIKINKNNVVKPKDMDDRCYNKMIKQVAGIKWTKSMLANQKITNYNKSLFAMGMALHVITDVYAHQAYMKNDNGEWGHIIHHSGYEDTCDNPDYPAYDNRFKCAKWAAESALGSFYVNLNPRGYDFFDFCNYKDFKIKRAKIYMINRGELGVDEYDEDVEKANID